jgi:hypothetical protein
MNRVASVAEGADDAARRGKDFACNQILDRIACRDINE